METIEYRHSEDMGQISGFGGGYEKTCQDMLDAGVKWLNEHPKHDDLNMRGLKNVFGLLEANSPDAKELERAILAAGGSDITGAMHHAVMSRLLFIAKNGWDKYCSEVRGEEKKEQTDSTNPVEG